MKIEKPKSGRQSKRERARAREGREADWKL